MSDTLQDIADAAEQLCDPRQHAEPRYEWDRNRHRKPIEPHRTIVPGLIQQLRDRAEPGNDGGEGGGGGEGSVPVAIDAVSLLAAVAFGAKRRALQWGLDLANRPEVEDHIRGLVGAASRRSHDDQRVLRSELRSWQWQSEIICGWRAAPRELLAPCPACNARGSLLAHPDADNPVARCVGCGARWTQDPSGGEGQITILAAHVTAYQRQSGETMAAARAAAVEVRRRREGQVAA
jgi:hypothetical protein